MEAWLQRIAWLCLAIALGLALAALQLSFGLAAQVMRSALIVLLGLGFAGACVIAWRSHRAIAKDDDC